MVDAYHSLYKSLKPIARRPDSSPHRQDCRFQSEGQLSGRVVVVQMNKSLLPAVEPTADFFICSFRLKQDEPAEKRKLHKNGSKVAFLQVFFGNA